MKRALWTLALLATGPFLAGEPAVHGDGVSDVAPIALAELLADPEVWVGKKVKVEGRITEVCPKMGCWIDIENADRSIRFKVKDGVIVFDKTDKGHAVVVEGIFARADLDHEQAIAWAQHEADERGVAFDPASVTGPMTIYRIDGTGAVVQ